MLAKRKEVEKTRQSVTTGEGLTSLLFHLVHATSHGQLDSDLVRSLCRHLNREADMLRSAGVLNAYQIASLNEAQSGLEQMLSISEGGLLAKAMSRLRKADRMSSVVSIEDQAIISA